MILDLIIKAVVAVLTGVLGLIPSYSLPSGVLNVGNTFGSGMATASAVFPVVVLGGCIAFIIGLKIFLVVFAGLVWIYNKIPAKFT